MGKLIALSYSPWSEKARWALDHHGIDYVEQAHTPMIGELALRAALKRWTGKVSGPAYVGDDGEGVRDSFEIAQYAEKHGNGKSSTLFPKDVMERIGAWNALSEQALVAGRALRMPRIAESPEALRESLPRFARELGPVGGAMGKIGIAFIARKYDVDAAHEEASRAAIRAVLSTTKAALSEDRSYLVEQFSFADIAMACVLQMVVPVDDRFIRLGPATRKVWTDEKLAGEFPDLVAWRDRLYQTYR